MGLQLIFAVETNQKCRSDWIYIKETIEYFYQYDRSHIKLSVVYMDSKDNYVQSKIKNKNDMMTIQYQSMNVRNRTEIIYCFDCDDFDIKPEDKKFLDKARQFCEDHNAHFLWFC